MALKRRGDINRPLTIKETQLSISTGTELEIRNFIVASINTKLN